MGVQVGDSDSLHYLSIDDVLLALVDDVQGLVAKIVGNFFLSDSLNS